MLVWDTSSVLVCCILFYVIELPRSAGALLLGAGPTFVGNPKERKCYYAGRPTIICKCYVRSLKNVRRELIHSLLSSSS